MTNLSGIDEDGFGQGIAIGDINSDGFDDIYIGNTGANSLWLNQGDGTFISGNALLPNHPPKWTTSALIADINGDGLSELYNANYVAGESIFTRRCQLGGKPSACSPLAFEPEFDEIFFPTPNGTFRHGGQSDQLLGNSLGLSFFRIQTEELPVLFVAIDQQANLLLRCSERGTLELPENEALLRGLAYDEDGNAQACMGIATTDVNNDGQVDIHVTNFFDEYNTLYIQNNGVFTDTTASLGLVAESLPKLGFGVQPVDVQRDGLVDFLVLNGHIDDQTHVGAPEAMPPQLYLQQPMGFSVIQDSSKFFASPAIGRSLARWDFDQDGRCDFVATYLDGPVRVLQNKSEQVRALVRLRLIGTESERAALTTRVTITGITPGGESFTTTQQLVGGGGYLATNELFLDFAIPADSTAIQATVDWPTGTKETFKTLDLGAEYLIVEGNSLNKMRLFDQPLQ